MVEYTAYFMNAFLLSIVLVPPLKRLAVRLQFVDRPDYRKWHSGPIPVVGGIAVFIAFAAVTLQLSTLIGQLGPLLLGAMMLVVIGIVDDYGNLNARVKLVGQTIAALVIISPGDPVTAHLGNLFGFGDIVLVGAGLPLTVLFVVGAINAFNMIDGIDGLAGGVAAVILFWLALAAALTDRPDLMVLSLILMLAIRLSSSRRRP